jgi:hypothetical protein
MKQSEENYNAIDFYISIFIASIKIFSLQLFLVDKFFFLLVLAPLLHPHNRLCVFKILIVNLSNRWCANLKKKKKKKKKALCNTLQSHAMVKAHSGN